MKGDVEDFQSIMKEIRKKDHQIENPRYKIFDFLNLEDFESRKSKVILSDRLACLDIFLAVNKSDILTSLHQIRVESLTHLESLKNQGALNKWEGLMLRKDTAYEGKRTSNLLKVKSFIEAEFTCTRIETGLFKMIKLIDGENKEVQVETMTNIVIDFMGLDPSEASV